MAHGNFLIRLLERPTFQVALVVLTGMLAYSNTLEVPFQLDDAHIIENNPIIQDLNYVVNPSEARDFPLYGHFHRRYISYLTFALNYHIHGLEVTGYHLFNLSIHLANALLLYGLVLLMFRTPHLAGSGLQPHKGSVAFLISLIFVAHPVNTEAVTYISQRMASLAVFFYLSGLVLYARMRFSLPVGNRPGVPFLLHYLLLLLVIALAVRTKEIALTLPVAILLYDLFFFPAPARHRAVLVLPLFLPLLFYLTALTESGLSPATVLYGADSPAPAMVGSSTFDGDYLNPGADRWSYFITQFRVLATYLRLLLIPVHQNLIYDYPLFHTPLQAEIVLSLFLLLSIMALGVYAYRRSITGEKGLRLISFGIAWFFLALVIESSLLPLPLLICEYRMYLPGAALLIALVSGIFLVPARIASPKAAPVTVCSLVVLALVFATATYLRNDVWQSKISLWEDIVSKTTTTPRGKKTMALMEVRYNLAHAYQEMLLHDKALAMYRQAIQVNPFNLDAYNNMGVIHLEENDPDRAISYFQQCLNLDPRYENAYFNLGEAYLAKEMPDEAIGYFQRFVRFRPDYADAYRMLATAFEKKGMYDEAARYSSRADSLIPDAD